MSGMIAYLSGVVEFIHEGYAVITTNGVGYKVFLTNRLLSTHSKGSQIHVFTYTHVRENMLDLYGFSSFQEQLLFEKMISISGIGPKIAIGIFQVGGVEEIARAIQSADVEFFTQVPRFGKKNAQKVILELKNSFKSDDLLPEGPSMTERNTIIAALVNFGFSKSEAIRALDELNGDGLSIEEKIRKSLQILGK